MDLHPKIWLDANDIDANTGTEACGSAGGEVIVEEDFETV